MIFGAASAALLGRLNRRGLSLIEKAGGRVIHNVLLIEQSLRFVCILAQEVRTVQPDGLDVVVSGATHRVRRIPLEVAVAGVHHKRHRLKLARDLLVRALLGVLRERSMLAENRILMGVLDCHGLRQIDVVRVARVQTVSLDLRWENIEKVFA